MDQDAASWPRPLHEAKIGRCESAGAVEKRNSGSLPCGMCLVLGGRHKRAPVVRRPDRKANVFVLAPLPHRATPPAPHRQCRHLRAATDRAASATAGSPLTTARPQRSAATLRNSHHGKCDLHRGGLERSPARSHRRISTPAALAEVVTIPVAAERQPRRQRLYQPRALRVTVARAAAPSGAQPQARRRA